MKKKEHAFIIIIFLVITTHLIFTHFRYIRKNNFGAEDSSRNICDVAEKIKGDYHLTTIGYKSSDSVGMEYLSKYYQMRYCLAPTNLTLSASEVDTVLVFNSTIKKKNTDGLEILGIGNSFQVLNNYNTSYTLIAK